MRECVVCDVPFTQRELRSDSAIHWTVDGDVHAEHCPCMSVPNVVFVRGLAPEVW